MKINVTKEMFVRAFREANRESNFSEEAKEAIYDYLIDMESNQSEIEPELDIIDICCSFTEVLKSDEDEMKNYSKCERVIELKDSVIFSS